MNIEGPGAFAKGLGKGTGKNWNKQTWKNKQTNMNIQTEF